MAMAPGDRIRDFEVLRHLGAGAFGTVYACRWDMDGRDYAVKLFDGSIKNAQREYIALQQVSHRNIVRCVYAASVDADHWYLQCELIDGEPLSARVRADERFDVDEAAFIGDQLLAALEAIHPDVERILQLAALEELSVEQFLELDDLERSGLVHRDVKPENIMVTPDGRVVLVDFGISSPSGSEVNTMSATQAYLPPDVLQIPGDRWRPDIDLFAAGVVVYEMCCAAHPYREVDYGTGPTPPPTDLPAPLRAWLLKACAARRSDRFESAPAMRQALRTAVGHGSPTVAERSTVAESQGDLRNAFGIVEYTRWEPHAVDGAEQDDLLALIREVVEVEGPIVCSRLYGVISAALGESERALRQTAQQDDVQRGQAGSNSPGRASRRRPTRQDRVPSEHLGVTGA